MSSNPEPRRLRRIRASALWAAYGDALGFITELADRNGVARRGAQHPVSEPVPWRRRVGGRFGPTVELPAGCISDDTQLRLATCRSIRGDGVFDVETFAKVELPIWSSYALGAGRGSQEAAANLRRRDVSWSTNFFDANRSVYINGGGNGAAMRIQPHIWAAEPNDARRWRIDVIMNAVCTHGHMRGILGALFHAACLRHALENGAVPGPREWAEAVEELHEVPHLIKQHDVLDQLWLGLWEQRSASALDDAVGRVIVELNENIIAVRDLPSGAAAYNDAVERLGAYRPEERGSGVKTAVLAAVAARLFEPEPKAAVWTTANRLGTDTDSIATMTGALLGATREEGPDIQPLDGAYIEREAERMWAIGEQRQAPSFPYPSIMTWSAPRSQIDCLCTDDGGLAVAGLGPAEATGNEIHAGSGNKANAWEWVDLWFGQRILIKRRARPNPLQESQRVSSAPQYVTDSLLDAAPREPRGASRSQPGGARPARSTEHELNPRRTLHQITDEVIASGFNPETIGLGLLEIAEREDGIELAGQYAGILAKARLTRLDRDRRR
jgi:ADP-ribosylglycohydrolase